MLQNFKFHRAMLDTLVGGVSAIDLPRLEITHINEAHEFLKTYGYDTNDASDLEDLWKIHRRAVVLLKDHILIDGESLHEDTLDPHKLKDIGMLLLFSSTKSRKDRLLQRSACSILRVMHVFAHLDNDLFVEFSEQIQEQVLKNFKEYVHHDPVVGTVLGRTNQVDQIHLQKFEMRHHWL